MKRIVVIFICFILLNCNEKELESEVDYVAKYTNKIIAYNEFFQKNEERNLFYVFNGFIDDFLIKPQEAANEGLKIANIYNNFKVSNYGENNNLLLSEAFYDTSQGFWSEADNKEAYDWIILNSDKINNLYEYIYKCEYFFYPEFYLTEDDFVKPTYQIHISNYANIINIIVANAFYNEKNIDDFIIKIDPLLKIVEILSNENTSYDYLFHNFAIKKSLVSIKNILEVDTSVTKSEKVKLNEILDYLMNKNSISVNKVENYIAEKNYTSILCEDLKYPEDSLITYNIFVDRVLSENRSVLNSIEGLNADTFIDYYDSNLKSDLEDINFKDKIVMFISKKKREDETIRLISRGHLTQMRMILLSYQRNSKLVESIKSDLLN